MHLPASRFLADRLGTFRPRVGLVLGSGLGFFADERIDAVGSVPYADIPDFPRSTVEGHAGRWVAGTVAGQSVLCMQGRFHFYEGYGMEQLALPVRVMRELGVEIFLLTNAAGGVRDGMRPGDFMLLSDHINFMGANPLRGANADAFGTRFPDMSVPYDADLRALARATAADLGLALAEGVYLAVSGPSFETPAEIRAFRALGADAVGMSTVPECIVARHAGMRVCAVSCITNLASGLSGDALTHKEVAETAARVRRPFADLIEGLLARQP
ncbi:MAG: purine-nucleoside phosphorylase [Opitutales bacterium]|nr:purine-nucleoside phosphorylase [Opitutales bacterium]